MIKTETVMKQEKMSILYMEEAGQKNCQLNICYLKLPLEEKSSFKTSTPISCADSSGAYLKNCQFVSQNPF